MPDDRWEFYPFDSEVQEWIDSSDPPPTEWELAQLFEWATSVRAQGPTTENPTDEVEGYKDVVPGTFIVVSYVLVPKRWVVVTSVAFVD